VIQFRTLRYTLCAIFSCASVQSRAILAAIATPNPGNVGQLKRNCPMKRLLLASAIAGLLTVQTANAKGCLQGAALGGVAGHAVHHTFLGIFGGCAGGMYVHHLYSKWKKAHPDGTMNDFVADNKDHLPAGWADRLSTVGDSNIRAGTTK
jgi:hypothetical protein